MTIEAVPTSCALPDAPLVRHCAVESSGPRFGSSRTSAVTLRRLRLLVNRPQVRHVIGDLETDVKSVGIASTRRTWLFHVKHSQIDALLVSRLPRACRPGVVRTGASRTTADRHRDRHAVLQQGSSTAVASPRCRETHSRRALQTPRRALHPDRVPGCIGSALSHAETFAGPQAACRRCSASRTRCLTQVGTRSDALRYKRDA